MASPAGTQAASLVQGRTVATDNSEQNTFPSSPSFRYIPVTGTHSPAVARNVGWRAACGEIIAFTDDDCIPDRNWLNAGVSAFVDSVVGV